MQTAQEINNCELVFRNNWYVYVGKNMELAYIFKGMYTEHKSVYFKFELMVPRTITIGGKPFMGKAGSGIEFPNNTTASNFYQYVIACRQATPDGKYYTCSKHKFFCLMNVYDSNGRVVGCNKVKFDDLVKRETFSTTVLPFKDLYCPPLTPSLTSIFNINGMLIDRITPYKGTRTITEYKDFLRPDELIRLGLISPIHNEDYLTSKGVTMPFVNGYSPRKPLPPSPIKSPKTLRRLDLTTRQIVDM